MIPPFAVTAAATEMARQAYANGERPSPPALRTLHLVLTRSAGFAHPSASALDEQGVDVARPMRPDLGLREHPSYDEGVAAGQADRTML
jgi:hypothetical protein